MTSMNIGILAHVDAGKTSLTERLLYTAGVIPEIGSVDHGSTQTDTLELERRRGMTIKSAAVSFAVGEVTVNLLDTPGHPDFIAEVERVLSVLDGAVLVVSAVEAVQPQTRVLMRTLQRLQIPTLIFVNKIDRGGAQCECTLRSLSEKLTPSIIAMGAAHGLGTRKAEVTPYHASDMAFNSKLGELLADHDDRILAAYIGEGEPLSYPRLRDELARQTKQARVHPVFLGSAITGAGIEWLMDGITELLPAAQGDVEGPLSATVFKIERGRSGEKVAYVRLFSGTLTTRDRVRLQPHGEKKVTAISAFERGRVRQSPSIAAGHIGKVWGLGDIRIGDMIGNGGMWDASHHFDPPTLETAVIPRRASDKGALHVALSQLAEQDPLINLRQDDVRQEMFLSLYGEVQKEVIQESLANDFGIEVAFRETTTIYIERPTGKGAAVEIIGKGGNPFKGTVGLRVEPAAINTGVRFRLEVELGSIPLSFHKAVEESVHQTLRQGLFGWQVTDCIVTMTDSGYWSPVSTAGDFRNLTPLVLMSALKQAGTTVHEPMHRFHLEMPADTYGPILPLLARLDAVPQGPAVCGSSCELEGVVPAARVHELRQKLPGVTRGEGVLECHFDRYRPIHGTIPTRARADNNPLNRKEYLLHVVRRV